VSDKWVPPTEFWDEDRLQIRAEVENVVCKKLRTIATSKIAAGFIICPITG
jgi:hypothetical protein